MQMTAQAVSLDSRLQSHLMEALDAATDELLLVSPFLGAGAVARVLKAAEEKNLDVRVLTRIELELMVSRSADLNAIEKLAQAGVRLRTLPRLHAKAYVFDHDTVAFGSANLTRPGLSGSIELVARTSDCDLASQVDEFAEELWRNAKSDMPTERILDLVAQAREKIKWLQGEPSDDDTTRAALTIVYIPKNAKERRASFELMLKCTDWRSVRQVRGDEHQENVRDVLDFGAYLGLLQKRGVHSWEGPSTTYRITPEGQSICRGVLSGRRSAAGSLRELLVSYAMPNAYVNVLRNPEHMECRVRPWLTLLRLLARMQQISEYSGGGFQPEEMAYVTLSVFHETQHEMRSALNRLMELDHCNGVSDRRRVIDNWITGLGSEPKKFRQAKAGIPTRLCRWAHYLGLIRCSTSDDSKRSLTSLLDEDIRITRVLGLTDQGRNFVERYQGTVYRPPVVLQEADAVE